MSRTSIHQLLHGYRAGHQLLAASHRLSREAADLTARLSDLSGVLLPGTLVEPYLTVYPVRGSEFVAVARTWLDEAAPRAGCVLTHTLLVPRDVWAACKNPRAFSALLVEPGAPKDPERFLRPLAPAPGVDSTPDAGPSLPAGGVHFVARYFGEGVRPIVWFDCEQAEECLWAVVAAAWPALRNQFAACTFSLQPRTLDDGPFDLLFAPGAAYPRFQDAPRAGLIRDPALPAQAEPWTREFAETVFAGRPSSIAGEVKEFGDILSVEPTAVRTLYLIRSLRARLRASPTAGVGLLDAVEAIAPVPTEAAAEKAAAVDEAVRSAVAGKPAEALKCLSLITERLTRPAFLKVRPKADGAVAKAVESLVPEHANEALRAPGGRLATEPDDSPYLLGLLDGLERLARSSPQALLGLRGHEPVAARAVRSRPQIAIGFLKGAKEADPSAADLLASWVRGVEDADKVQALRDALLPVVDRDEEAPLARELLQTVPAGEAARWLESLARTTDGFKPLALRQVARDVVAARHASETTRWAGETRIWTEGAAEVTAGAFEDGPSGLSACLAAESLPPDRRALVVSALIVPTAGGSLAAWVGSYARASGDFLVPLLALGRAMPPRAAHALSRCLSDVPDLALARTPDLFPRIGGVSGQPFFPALVDQAMRSLVRGYIEGGITAEHSRHWQGSDWGRAWFPHAIHHELPDIIGRAAFASQGTWERAWFWLADAPGLVYQHGPGMVASLVRSLVNCEIGYWTPETGAAWGTVLRRVRAECDHSTALRLAVDAIQHCFARAHLPFGRVVAAAFPVVYTAVAESRSTPAEAAPIFGFFDWDRAKELRKRLIEAFLGSSWEPGDLAVAAGGEGLLRKIFKRLRRKYSGGESYIEAMAHNLAHRSDPEAWEAREVLTQLRSDPHFYEPWD